MAKAWSIHGRQINGGNDGVDDGSDDYNYWPYTETAWIIKWVVAGVIVLFLIGFIGGGYLHAQRRIKKGLRPLRYHMWLVPRRQRAQFYPPPVQSPYVYYNPGGYGPQGQSFQMQPTGPAPPAYHEGYVPAYTPPSKVNPDQSYAIPPPGPPPNGSSSSHPPAGNGTGVVQH